MTAPMIDAALRAGCRLHVFLSGGGLRVVRLERKSGLRAYGEGPVLEDALRLAAEDYAAGGRPYGEVYGVTQPHYLTGQSAPSGDADAWVRRGATIDAEVCNDVVCVWMRGLAFSKMPDSVIAESRATGRPVLYVDRGVLRECTASGDGWASGRHVELAGLASAHHVERGGYRPAFISARIVKFGFSGNFATALADALACEETERPDERER